MTSRKKTQSSSPGRSASHEGSLPDEVVDARQVGAGDLDAAHQHLAVAEQETVVTRFVSLLMKEEEHQAGDPKKGSAVRSTVTDLRCSP